MAKAEVEAKLTDLSSKIDAIRNYAGGGTNGKVKYFANGKYCFAFFQVNSASTTQVNGKVPSAKFDENYKAKIVIQNVSVDGASSTVKMFFQNDSRNYVRFNITDYLVNKAITGWCIYELE